MTMELLLSAEAGKWSFQQENKKPPALKSNLQERMQEFLKRQGLKPGVLLFPGFGCSRTTFPVPCRCRTPAAAPRRSPHSLPAARARGPRLRRGGTGGAARGGGTRAEGGRAREKERERENRHTFVLGLRVRVAAEQIRHVGHGGSDVTRRAARAGRPQPGGGGSQRGTSP